MLGLWHRRAFWAYWAAVVTLLPFFVYTGAGDSRDHHHLALLYASLFSVLIFGVGWTSLRWLLVAGIGLFASFSIQGRIPFFHTTSFMLLGAVYGSFINYNKAPKRFLMDSLAVSCLFQCAWIWANFAGYDPFFYLTGVERQLTRAVEYEPVVGSLGHWMVSGAHLVGTGVFLFRPGWKWAIPLFLSSLVILNSGIAIVSAAALALVVLAIRKPRALMYVIPFAIPAVAWLWKYTGLFEGYERLAVWKVTLTQFWANKWFGHGFGYFQTFFSSKHKFTEVFYHPHNELVLSLVAVGVVGTLLIVSFIAQHLLKFKKEPYFAACAFTILVNAMASFPFHIAPTALLFVLCLAMLKKSAYTEIEIIWRKT